MAKETDAATHDYNAKLAQAILLLAERVTPKPLHPAAKEAIEKHAELTRRLQFIVQPTQGTPTTQGTPSGQY
jgi:hypothetical protein